MATRDPADQAADDPDDTTGHETDKAELAERDRPQPNLVTRRANRRAEQDEPDADAQRVEMVDRIEEEREAIEGR